MVDVVHRMPLTHLARVASHGTSACNSRQATPARKRPHHAAPNLIRLGVCVCAAWWILRPSRTHRQTRRWRRRWKEKWHGWGRGYRYLTKRLAVCAPVYSVQGVPCANQTQMAGYRTRLRKRCRAAAPAICCMSLASAQPGRLRVTIIAANSGRVGRQRRPLQTVVLDLARQNAQHSRSVVRLQAGGECYCICCTTFYYIIRYRPRI